MKMLGPHDGTSFSAASLLKPKPKSKSKSKSKPKSKPKPKPAEETFEDLDESLVELDSIEDGLLEDFGETEIETTTGKNSESESEEK